jgi:two-component system sensor histidine kinase KdpD
MEESEELRPNPQDLLRAITKEEIKGTKGRLKIFLGMSAGVGKTYSMLEEAHRMLKLGTDVVAGTIDTHGRSETAVLLEGIPVIPEKWYKYKDTVFEELDIDAIIARKPQLVLIDELAHTNVPGSRHPKRWQDVVEVLDNGIDVYTTLNVQHIDSLKDDIENIAGIAIRETVPDMIIEAADYIELVDIPPDTLLQRLKEGKVYLGDQSEIAARHFFKQDRLTALREMVLRYAAAKIDHDLQGMVSTVERKEGWQPGERLLVAVSPSPHSQKLIRKTRRLAFNLNAPWIALHVDDGRELSEEQKSLLSKNITLARELGAEVITTQDPAISEAILRIARQRGVTQIIIGRPPKRFFRDFFGYTLLDQLAIECADIDIHVLRQRPIVNPYRYKFHLLSFPKEWSSYLIVLMMVMLLTFISGIIVPIIGYKVVGFFFLASILSLSLIFLKGPVILASLVYAVIWVYYFIPKSEGVPIYRNEDFYLFFLYILTAVFTSVLIDRARKNRQMLLMREVSAEVLYDIVRSITNSTSSKNAIQSVKEKVTAILPGKCNIIIKTPDNGLNFTADPTVVYDEKEKAAAGWVFENGKEAGWSTTTLPMVKNLYLPLKGFDEIVGVLAYEPNNEVDISVERKNFLYTVGQQLANQIERSFREEK